MSFVEAVQTCFRKYATFSGRAGRPEYWWWMLFAFGGGIAAGMVDNGLGAEGGLQGLFSLAILLPGLAVAVRRLHDIGRSAWWLLILYAPAAIGIVFIVVGMIAAFASIGLGFEVGVTGLVSMALGVVIALGGVVFAVYTMTRPSQPGANRYGPPPALAPVEA